MPSGFITNPGCCCTTAPATGSIAFGVGCGAFPPSMSVSLYQGTTLIGIRGLGGSPGGTFSGLTAGVAYTLTWAGGGARYPDSSASITATSGSIGFTIPVGPAFLCCTCSYPISKTLTYSGADGTRTLSWVPSEGGDLTHPCGYWQTTNPTVDHTALFFVGTVTSGGGFALQLSNNANAIQHGFACPTSVTTPQRLLNTFIGGDYGTVTITEVF